MKGPEKIVKKRSRGIYGHKHDSAKVLQKKESESWEKKDNEGERHY